MRYHLFECKNEKAKKKNNSVSFHYIEKKGKQTIEIFFSLKRFVKTIEAFIFVAMNPKWNEYSCM